MNCVLATESNPRKVRSRRTASGVRAWVQKRVQKHPNKARMGMTEERGRPEKDKSTCTDAVELVCLSISIGIQFP
jgi:hypothetical protein